MRQEFHFGCLSIAASSECPIPGKRRWLDKFKKIQPPVKGLQ
jgi:hypothetical protein